MTAHITHWRKSSYTSRNNACVEIALTDAHWRTSTQRTGEGHCVAVADLHGDGVGIRDSKNPTGPVLTISHTSFRGLLRTASFD